MDVVNEMVTLVDDFHYSDLPMEVIVKAKKVLLDTIGITIPAWPGQASKIIRAIVEQIGGAPEATIIGSGKKVPCSNAALANNIMVRYLDFMDTDNCGHPSLTIPGILAVGEKVHATGEDILEGIVLGYELSARYGAAVPPEMHPHSGWHEGMRFSFTTPLLAGKLLGLTKDQLANAFAISLIGTGPPLGISDSGDVPYTMMKTILPALCERGGILAALLAQGGWTGDTESLFEHPRGYELVRRAATDKPIDHQQFYSKEPIKGRYSDRKYRWQIFQVRQKYYAAESGLQGILLALMKIIKENNIWPQDVKQVTVHTYDGWQGAPGPLGHLFDPSKRYPTTKETADHSAYYVIAAAITDHAMGPDQYSPEKLRDPTIIDLIGKIEGVEKPELRKTGSAIVEIETVHGETYTAQDYWRWPMPDDVLEEKFKLCTSRLMTEEQSKEIMNTIYNLEKLTDIGQLMELLVI